jgi:hypothetical protein
MQLTETEQRLVGRLKRRQKSFKRWRWAGLLGSLFNIGVGFYFGTVTWQYVWDYIRLGNSGLNLALAVGVLMMWPCLYFTTMLSFVAVLYLIKNWNGSPQTLLLLKFVEESKSQEV